MAETEIKGIFQGDVVIRKALLQGLDNLYNNPELLDDIFQSLVEDELTRDEYGAKQVDIAKKWFLDTNIPVMMNFRVAEQAMPCIAISLQESVEAEQTHGDVHYVPQQETEGDWPALTDKFNPVRYSPTSGIMVLPADVMGNQLVAPGMFIVNCNGQKFMIIENLGDDEIALAPRTFGDFTDIVIRGSRPRYVTTIESLSFKETYQIGIHVMSEPSHLLFLHAIVKFILLKYKQDLLESRGFERSAISSTDFRRNMEFDVEEAFSRYINITGYVRESWPKTKKPMIDVVNLGGDPDVAFDGLVISAAGDDTDGEEPVGPDGEPSDNDPWSVIPFNPLPAAVAAAPRPPPIPPEEGLVFWVKGDAELTSTAGNLTFWGDQSGQSQDLNVISLIAPQTGIDTIDGIPAVTFPAGDDGAYAARAAALRDRNGVPMAYVNPRTVMAIIRPTLHASVARIGGPVFSTADQPNFECLFQIENWFTFNDAWFIFDNLWSFSGNQRLAPTSSIATWQDVNVLSEWRSSGFPEIAFAVNGGDDEQLQTPGSVPTTTQAGAEGTGAGSTFAVGNCWNAGGGTISANFHGIIAEIIVWDYDLRSDPVAYAQALAYFRSRYPSVGI